MTEKFSDFLDQHMPAGVPAAEHVCAARTDCICDPEIKSDLCSVHGVAKWANCAICGARMKR